MEVKRFLTELFGKYEFIYIDFRILVFLQIAKQDKKQCEAGKTLLPVNDISNAIFLADND